MLVYVHLLKRIDDSHTLYGGLTKASAFESELVEPSVVVDS